MGSIPTRVIQLSPCTDTPEGYISLVLTARTRSLSRIAAALAAVIALLVAPVRPVLECTMPAAASVADEHAGHEMPADDTTPAHQACPDLAHCVAVAPLVVATSVEIESAVRVELHTPVVMRPTSATTSLEPPPPK